MPRLEKALYEKLFNSAALGRARVIGAPKKPIYKDSYEYNQYLAGSRDEGFISKLLNPIYGYLHKRFVWQWQRDLALQRGYAMDDFYVYEEKELRRSPFMEHVWRDSCHPYQWLMFKARRRRYYKVERTVQGYYVPDYVRDEVKQRTMSETILACDEWKTFMNSNYFSDMTPTTMMGTGGKLNPLEVMNVYGIFKLEAWERYFYNEETYDIPDQEQYDSLFTNPFGYDLDTEAGRREFEGEMNGLVADYPGWFVPEGESFNFTAYYAKRAIAYNKDTSQFTTEQLDQARAALEEQAQTKQALGISGEGADASVGQNTIGAEVSDVISRDCGRRAFMN